MAAIAGVITNWRNLQDLRDQHRELRGLDRQQRGRNNDADHVAGRSHPLIAHRVHQYAGRQLAYQRGHGAQCQGEADFYLGPFARCQIDGDKRPNPVCTSATKKLTRSSARSPPGRRDAKGCFMRLTG